MTSTSGVLSLVLVALASILSLASASAAVYAYPSSAHLKRSVNFTPSWGKRSMLPPMTSSDNDESEADEYTAANEDVDMEIHCAARTLYAERLAQKLKV
jgi:hypothetical protein